MLGRRKIEIERNWKQASKCERANERIQDRRVSTRITNYYYRYITTTTIITALTSHLNPTQPYPTTSPTTSPNPLLTNATTANHSTMSEAGAILLVAVLLCAVNHLHPKVGNTSEKIAHGGREMREQMQGQKT